jgi:hypothetical protein
MVCGIKERDAMVTAFEGSQTPFITCFLKAKGQSHDKVLKNGLEE